MNHSAASCHGKTHLIIRINIIEGFRGLGYHTIGTGAFAWFDQNTPTGSVLAAPFDQFWYSGKHGIYVHNFHGCLTMRLQEANQPLFIFLNRNTFLLARRCRLGAMAQSLRTFWR